MTREGTRWEPFSGEEFHLIHHSLRMLAKYLSGFDSDKADATSLANEMWNLHAQPSAEDGGEPVRGTGSS